MKASFALYARVAGSFVPVKIRKGTPIAPDGASSYYIRYSRDGKSVRQPAGSNLAGAYESMKRMEYARSFEKDGIALPAGFVDPGAESLPDTINAYLEETRGNKARKTWLAYARTLALFLQSCKRPSASTVIREDVIAFKTYLRGEGFSERSVYNHFLNLMVFLKAESVPVGIKDHDWPAKPEREPEAYPEEEIDALLKAANNEERLILKCFLCSGVRDGELAHLTYGDIDFANSVWTIRPKEGWATKTKKSQRDVPVSPEITRKLRERMTTNSRSLGDFIFTNSEGKPNLHMLRITKRVAKRAGVTGRVDNHKFRSTAITLWLRAGHTPQDVMAWVGHSNLTTILRYAAKINVRSEATSRKAAAPFRRFVAAGD